MPKGKIKARVNQPANAPHEKNLAAKNNLVPTVSDVDILVMGQYTIIDKSDPNRLDKLEVPGIQTCIGIFLESETHFAIAHVDTPHNVTMLVEKMVNALGESDAHKIKATLIGGLTGYYSTYDSSPIYLPIYNSLTKHGIKYTHDEYSYILPEWLLPTSYVALQTFSVLGDESYLSTCFYATLAGVASYAVNMFIPNNRDVTIDLNDGSIKTAKNDLKSLDKSLNRLRRSTSDQNFFLKKRYELNPRSEDPQVIKALSFAEVKFTKQP